MPCHTRMKTTILQGLLWLCLLNFGMVISIIEPGYLDFDNLPDTNFSCVGKVIGGYYADLETSCQMFHVCTIGQLDEPMDIRFLCLNGTVFDQETRVCERVDEVDCSKSEKFYHLNLELYGNTAPPIVEEPNPTPSPSKSTSTTPRTTTTSRTLRTTYSPPTSAAPKVIDSHQYPVGSPDIRFNPEEINIRLTPGSPPIIKAPSQNTGFQQQQQGLQGGSLSYQQGNPSVSFHQQAFAGAEPRITVTTHGSVFNKDIERHGISSSTLKPKSVVSYGLSHATSKNYNYDYGYQQTEGVDLDYNTEVPLKGYSYHDPLEYEQHTDLESEYKKNYVPTTKSPDNFASSSFSPSKTYFRTEKPPLQIPQSLIPTLPPLTFSSPAPFTLTRHFDQKRSNDHHEPPKIIVSASASVSDASGRRLNYSLGTIGASHIIGSAPTSYDDYREADVGLDPFYHDVPKVNGGKNKTRQKRDLRRQKRSDTVTHWVPPDYVDDNYEPLTYEEPTNIEKLNESVITEDPKISDDYYDEVLDDSKNVSNKETHANKKVHIEQIDERIDQQENEEYLELTTQDSLKDLLHAEILNSYASKKDNNKPELTTKNSLGLTEAELVVTQETTMESNPVTNVVPTTTCCTNKKSKEDYEKATRLLDELLAQILKEAMRGNFPKLQRKTKLTTPKLETTTEHITASTTEFVTTENIHTSLEDAKLESVSVTTEMSNSVPTEAPETTTHKIIVSTLPTLKSILSRNKYLEVEENLPIKEFSTVASADTEPRKRIYSTEINILKSESSSEEEDTGKDYSKNIRKGLKPKPVLQGSTHEKIGDDFNKNIEQEIVKPNPGLQQNTDDNIGEYLNKNIAKEFGKSKPVLQETTHDKLGDDFKNEKELVKSKPVLQETIEDNTGEDFSKNIEKEVEKSKAVLQEITHDKLGDDFKNEKELVKSKPVLQETIEDNTGEDFSKNIEKEVEKSKAVLQKTTDDKTGEDFNKNTEKEVGNSELVLHESTDDKNDGFNGFKKNIEKPVEQKSGNIDDRFDYKYLSSTEESTRFKSRTGWKNRNRIRGRTRYTTKTSYYDTSTEKVESTPKYRGRNRNLNRKTLDSISSETIQHKATTAEPNNYDDTIKELDSKTEDTVISFTINDKYISSTKQTILESESRNEEKNKHLDITTEHIVNFETTELLNTESFVPEQQPTSGSLSAKLDEKMEETTTNHDTIITTPESNNKKQSNENQDNINTETTQYISPTEETVSEQNIEKFSHKQNSEDAIEEITYPAETTQTILSTEIILESESTHRASSQNLLLTDEKTTLDYLQLNSQNSEPTTTENIHNMEESTQIIEESTKNVEENTHNLDQSTDLSSETTTELSTPEAVTMEIQNRIFEVETTESILPTQESTPFEQNEKIDYTTEKLLNDNEQTTYDITTQELKETTINPLYIEESTPYDVSKNTILEEEISTTESFKKYLYNTKIYDKEQEISTTDSVENTDGSITTHSSIDNTESTESSTTDSVEITTHGIETKHTTEISKSTIPSDITTQETDTTLHVNSEISTEAITTISPILTTTISTTSARYRYRGTRKPTYKRNRQKPTPHPKHRFSSPSIIMSQSVLRLGNKRLTTEMIPEDNLVTDPELSKSANPTEAKHPSMSTTPITKVVFSHKKIIDKSRRFNCLDKKLNRFYEDPRDCRLFHYCTPGFSETQVLDMKFVCDSGTYFDVEKLICTKIKPLRCK